MIQFNEYSLKLSSTGETLLIAEISEELFGSLDKSNLSDVIDKCIQIPKDFIEEAKLGYTDRLQTYLKTPPIGVMIKFNRFCRLFDDCNMADRKICNTKNSVLSKKSIPVCWEYGKPAKVGSFLSLEEEFSSLVVRYWNERRMIIIPQV